MACILQYRVKWTRLIRTIHVFQDVNFIRSYTKYPTVLLTAKHTTSGGNAVPECNGIVTWIEVQTDNKKCILKPTYLSTLLILVHCLYQPRAWRSSLTRRLNLTACVGCTSFLIFPGLHVRVFSLSIVDHRMLLWIVSFLLPFAVLLNSPSFERIKPPFNYLLFIIVFTRNFEPQQEAKNL